LLQPARISFASAALPNFLKRATAPARLRQLFFDNFLRGDNAKPTARDIPTITPFDEDGQFAEEADHPVYWLCHCISLPCFAGV
jgi:hypothetical protein